MSKQGSIKCIEGGCLLGAYKSSRCKHHYKIFAINKNLGEKAFYGSDRLQRLPKNWSSIRASILERDEYVCYICRQPGADSVDHIVAGDNNSPNNLAAAHLNVPPFCHRLKSAQEGAAASKASREKERELLSSIDHFSPSQISTIMNRDGDKCHICSSPGADYIMRISGSMLPLPSNLAMVHYHAQPNCLLSTI